MRTAVLCLCLLPLLAVAMPGKKDRKLSPTNSPVKTSKPDVDYNTIHNRNPYNKKFIAALKQKITAEYKRQAKIVDKSQTVNPYEPEIELPKEKTVFEKLEELNKDTDPNQVIEGDIMKYEENHVINRRAAVNNANLLWPNGVVPYQFHSSFQNPSYKNTVRVAMNQITALTCVTFVEIPDGTSPAGNSVSITNQTSGSCYSYVGKRPIYPQPINLGSPLCVTNGIVSHELMHAIGFWHEQSRPDRDSYVRVITANIQPGKEHNFDKQVGARTLQGYDLGSIMHYSSRAFSRNGLRTIEALNGNNNAMGQRTALVATDIAGINELYGCSGAINGQWGQWQAYSACTMTCGNGVRSRTRQCDSPSPLNGGSTCQGASLQTESCNMGSCTGSTGDIICNFDSGSMCGWTTSTGTGNNQLTWRRRQGPTPSSSTGPSSDHTTAGNGYYVYVEMSWPAQQYQYALLKSPPLISKGSGQQRCLTFWIHHYGNGMGKTQVLLRNLITNTETPITQEIGDQGNQWYFNEINFDASYPSQVIFKGERASSWQSDMALDDIHINYEPCDIDAHSCSFEGSTCSWTVQSNSRYPILTKSGRTPSSRTGPSAAATGTGYVYAEASWPARSGDISTLTSPAFQPPVSVRCMRFSTHMYGTTMGTLYVRRIILPSEVGITLATYSGNINAWISRSLTIGASGSYKIQFKFRRGSSWSGDIAVDAVTFTDGAC